MPRIMNQPILAVGKLGAVFFSLATVVTNAFKIIKTNLLQSTNQTNMLLRASNSDELSIAQSAQVGRILIEQQKNQKLGQLYQQDAQNRLNALQQSSKAQQKIALENAEKQLALQNAIRTQQQKQKTGMAIGMGLNVLGLGLTLGASQVDSKNNYLKGGLTAGGALAQGAGTFAMMLPTAGPLIATLAGLATALPGILQAIGLFNKTAQERIKELQQAAQQKNNEAIKKIGETKDLNKQIQEIQKLQAARYDSVEAEEAYYQATSKLAQQYPNLISSIDQYGNVTINLNNAQNELAEVRAAGVAAAKQAAKAEHEYQQTKLQSQKANATAALFNIDHNAGQLRAGNQNQMDKLFLDWVTSRLPEGKKQSADAIIAKTREMRGMNEIGTQYSTELLKLLNDYFENEEVAKEVGRKMIDYRQASNSISPQIIKDFIDSLKTNENLSYQDTLIKVQDYLYKYANSDNIENLNSAIELFDTLNSKDFKINGQYAMDSDWYNDIAAVIKSYQVYAKNSDQAKNIDNSKIATIVGQALFGGKENFLKEMPNASAILTQQIQTAAQNSGDINEFIDNIDTAIEQVRNAWDEFWQKSFHTDEEREAFNNLLKSSKGESRESCEKIFSSQRYSNLTKQMRQALLDSLYNNVYTYDDLKKRYEEKASKSDLSDLGQFEKVFSSMISGRRASFLENLGSNELKAVNSFYDRIAGLIRGGTISPFEGADLTENYLSLIEQAEQIKDSETKNAVESLIFGWDGTLTGLLQLQEKIKSMDTGDVDFSGLLNELISNLPVNLTTEFGWKLYKITFRGNGKF